ncbi:MAG TPA: hypothetical protein VGF84_07845 [Micromonosporaceae bacterium]
MSTLDIRYRRLMFAYPREYRRHRGAEIAATLAEMAPEGRRWPRGRDAASLLRHGLRARLGRPRSRFIVPITLLAVLIGGFAAAGAGARAGWTGPTSTGDAQVSTVALELQQGRASSFFVGFAGTTDGVPGLLFANRSDLEPARSVTFWPYQMSDTNPSGSGDPSAEQAKAALIRSGWMVTGERAGSVTLRRGSVAVDVLTTADPNTPAAITVYRVTPWPVPVLMAVAGVLGALLTYLLVGWVSRRAAQLGPARQRWILAGSVVTLLFAAPAAIVCAAGVWAAAVNGVRIPIGYWAGFSAGDLRPAALVAAVALVATVWCASAVRPFEAPGDARPDDERPAEVAD